MVKVTKNHKLNIRAPGANLNAVKYHWFIEKIYIWECSMKKVHGKDQKANIFTRDIQVDIFLHIRFFVVGW